MAKSSFENIFLILSICINPQTSNGFNTINTLVSPIDRAERTVFSSSYRVEYHNIELFFISVNWNKTESDNKILQNYTNRFYRK